MLLPQAAASVHGAQAAATAKRNEETKLSMGVPSQTASRVGRDSDGLDSVSQVSVLTPKSQAYGPGFGSRAGDSVSYISRKSGQTTVSTKEKLHALER